MVVGNITRATWWCTTDGNGVARRSRPNRDVAGNERKWGYFLAASSASLSKEEVNQGIEVDIETLTLTLTLTLKPTLTPTPTLSVKLN